MHEKPQKRGVDFFALFRASLRKLVVFGSLWCASTAAQAGCGVTFDRLPQSHFEGVDEKGRVSHWESLGDIELGDGLTVPLVAGFKSDLTGQPSPYLGANWILPLLESHIYALDDHAFQLRQIDGYLRSFGRDGEDPNVLHGTGGWKGQIRGDTITLWASCGWKFDFHRGRLRSFTTPQDRTMQFVQAADGTVNEVREGGRTVLKIVREGITTGAVTGFEFGEERMGVEFGDKPRVQVIAGSKVIGGMDRAMTKVAYSDGTERTYAYGVDEKLNPTFQPAAGRLIAWNPEDGTIVRDGDWAYTITPPDPEWNNAKIERASLTDDSKKELWHYDAAKGREVVQGIDGVQRIRSWFISGALAGKIRKLEEEIDGQMQKSISFSYDENGRLLRISKTIDDYTSTIYAITYNQDQLPAMKQYNDEAPLSFKYNDRHDVVAITRNGAIVYQKLFDPKTNSIIEKFDDGTVRTRRELGNGKRSEVLQFPDGTKQQKSYHNNELLSSVTTYQ